MLAGSAGLWGASVGLRRAPEIRRRKALEACVGEEPNLATAIGCPVGVGVASGIDTMTFWGLSYATALPATALLGGAGYFAGHARRRPLRRPRAVTGVGIAIALTGAAVWAAPRLAFAFSHAEPLDALNPTFYAGLGATGVGAAVAAYAVGSRDQATRRRAVAVGLSPHGVHVSGAF